MSMRERGDRGWLRLAAALVIMAAFVAVPGGATAAERAVSVASRIPGSLADAARPVTIIDREDIALSGMTDLYDLLVGRAAYNDFGLHRPLVLGSSHAVFLIDGRRIPNPDTTYVLEFLPLSAVERVEILSSGATAIHGSEAVAGAINIVLRRDYKGFEVQASGEQPSARGADLGQGGFLWGGALGRGNLMIGFDAYRRQEIRSADREYSRAKWTPGGEFADTSGVSIGGNTLFIPTETGLVARPIGECSGGGYVGPLMNPAGIPGSGCGYAYADIAWETADFGRWSTFVNFDHPFGEKSDIYLHTRIARADMSFRYAPSVGDFVIPASPELQERLLDAYPEIGEAPPAVLLYHRFVGHGNRDWRSKLDEFDVTLGVKGKLPGGVGYDVHLRAYRFEEVENGETFVSESEIGWLSALGIYDFENPLSSAPTHLEALRASALRLDHHHGITHKVLRASLDGRAFPLAGGDLRWAAGAEIDDERQHDDSGYTHAFVFGDTHDAADVLGSGGITFKGERRRMSGFAEVRLPPLPDWSVTLAGRHDNFDDVDGVSSLQVSSAYRLNRMFTLRGSWDKGGRPPSLAALNASDIIDFPYVCDTRNHTDPTAKCDRAQVEMVSGGNPALEPDEAESFSAGVKANLGFLSVSADWFQIEISEHPALLPAQRLVDMEAQGQPLPPGAVVHREGANGAITQIVNPLVNTGEETVAGIDMRARAGWNAGWANLVADLRWLHATKQEARIGGRLESGDHPRNRVYASLRAGRGGLTASWSVHMVSGYENDSETGRYESWVGHDVTLRWRNPFGVKGMSLAAGVLNVADRGPSVDSADPSAAAVRLDSVRGRTFFARVRMSW